MFEKQIKEDARNIDPTSPFAKHLLDENHHNDLVAEILHVEKKGLRLNAVD
jgi:hypothetical protein